MKLSAKMSFLTVGVAITAITVCCLFIIGFTKQTTMANVINTGSIDHQRFMTQFNDEFPDGINDITPESMRSYIIYKFRNCYGVEEYTLQSSDSMLVNNIGIDAREELNRSAKSIITESGAAMSYTYVKQSGKTYLLIGQTWQQSGDEYFISLVRDISSTVVGLSTLVRNCILVCLAVVGGASVLILYFVHRMLLPLKELSKSTGLIANGAYDSPVNINGKDEFSMLANNFNHMALAIQQRIDELETTAEQRRMLLSALSHEMKTPVTAISGFANALTVSKINETQKMEAIDFIGRESRRLERLSQKLAQLIVLDGAELFLSEVECPAFVDELTHILVPIARSHAIQLNITCNCEFIKIEHDLIICLITNLFDNSKKAKATKITISIDRHNISVTDNGIGIPKDQLGKVTQPFYTLNQSRSGENFGLGLALAYKIADLHNARFDIESFENQGTTISVLLP